MQLTNLTFVHGAIGALSQTGLRRALIKLLRPALCLLLVTGTATVTPSLALAQNMTPFPNLVMSAAEAHKQALTKKIILLDIRRPGEWARSGVGTSAQPITMHQSATKFFGQLDKLTMLDKTKPIALICATGVRSAYLQRILRKRGYSNIINVGEGMFGSRHGAGWIKAGLPRRQFKR